MVRTTRRSGTNFGPRDLLGCGFNGQSISLDSPPKLSHRRKHKIEVVVDRAVVRRSTRSDWPIRSNRCSTWVKALFMLRGWATSRMNPVGLLTGSASTVSAIAAVELRRNGSAPFLVQQPAGLVPTLPGFGRAARCESGGSHPRRPPEPSPGGSGRMAGMGVNAALRPDDRGPRSRRSESIWICRLTTWTDVVAGSSFMAPEKRGIESRASNPTQSQIRPGDEGKRPGPGLTAVAVTPDTSDVMGFAFQYKGLFPAIEEAARVSFMYRFKLQGMVDDVPCAGCMGARLRDDAAAVRFKGFALDQISRWSLGQALAFFGNLGLDEDERHIAGDLVREVRDRLKFLVDVGLDYLSLARGTPTLSGGESQRIASPAKLVAA